jgi:hypothetical protein
MIFPRSPFWTYRSEMEPATGTGSISDIVVEGQVFIKLNLLVKVYKKIIQSHSTLSFNIAQSTSYGSSLIFN